MKRRERQRLRRPQEPDRNRHGLSIGRAAAASGVKVATIRYYESIGLMPPPPRTASGRRLYDEADVKRLAFIRHARALGFAIDDIAALLRLADDPDAACADADAIARRHLAAIDNRLARLQALRDEIAEMVRACPGGTTRECRVIEVVADHTHCRHHREP